jgi:hypothetical protein
VRHPRRNDTLAARHPLRRSNFNKMSAWPHAFRAIGAEGLHFHDLRHAGNHFAAASGASLKDLMARIGHDSERAAIIYQHEARGADLVITSAIDAHIEAVKATRSEQRDCSREGQLRCVNGPLMAREIIWTPTRQTIMSGVPADLGFHSGAGDENRTRTISLGSFVIRTLRRLTSRFGCPLGYRHDRRAPSLVAR